jgi:UDP-N-acetylmuramoyl-tripeptide--D-alanyl-D-alanine ligase
MIRRGRVEYWIRQAVLGPVVRALRPVSYWTAYVWRRLLLRTTFIAVTGSLAKTTTKECLAVILSTHGRTFRSFRNQNATGAVALNLLRVRPWHRYAVLEVAAGAPGTMRRSARLVRPDAVLVLNVLKTHSTAYESLEQHAAEKEILLHALRPGGLAVLNGDDPLVRRMTARGGRVLRVGTASGCDLRASDATSLWPDRLSFTLHHAGGDRRIFTQFVGTHWLTAVLAALAAAAGLDVEIGKAASAIRAAEPFPGRLQPVRLPNGAIVLRDDYNASIDTVETSLRVLEQAAAPRRVLAITDLSDFGGNRKQRLKYLARIAPRAAEVLVLVGEMAEYGRRRAIDQGMAAEQVHAFPALRPAAEFLRLELRAGDLVLIKGRTTDHAARLFLAQLGPVGCWKDYCPKRMLCDICWELDITPRQLRQATLVPPPEAAHGRL